MRRLPTMTEQHHHDADIASLPTGQHLHCKTCYIVLGSISSTGVLQPTRTEGAPCDTCRPFEELHAAVVRAYEEFEKVQHRRQDFGLRVKAVAQLMTSRQEFGNFMLATEQMGQTASQQTESTAMAPTNEMQDQNGYPVPILAQDDVAVATNDDDEGDDSDDDSADERLQQALSTAIGNVTRGQKRARSASEPPTASKRQENDDDEQGSPSRKRLRQSKRVSFDSSVVFGDDPDPRLSSMFHRASTETYVPGRFALQGGAQYLDTSGFLVDYGVYHRQKWTGRKWVPRSDSSQDSDSEDSDYTDSSDDTPEAVGPVSAQGYTGMPDVPRFPEMLPALGFKVPEGVPPFSSPNAIDPLLSLQQEDTETFCAQVPNSQDEGREEEELTGGPTASSSFDAATTPEATVPRVCEVNELRSPDSGYVEGDSLLEHTTSPDTLSHQEGTTDVEVHEANPEAQESDPQEQNPGRALTAIDENALSHDTDDSTKGNTTDGDAPPSAHHTRSKTRSQVQQPHGDIMKPADVGSVGR